MPKRIPVSAAKLVAVTYDCRQVILVALDNDNTTHVVTYGSTEEQCDQAAQGGDFVKKALGWPESLNAMPNRVKALSARVKELEARDAGAVFAALEDSLTQLGVNLGESPDIAGAHETTGDVLKRIIHKALTT